jgi:hypothetical protein
MWSRTVFCIAAGIAATACASGPATSIVTAQGGGAYEVNVRAWKEEQVNGQVTTAATAACNGPYREIKRSRSVLVCADIPLSQCPPVAWAVTIQCEESA